MKGKDIQENKLIRVNVYIYIYILYNNGLFGLLCSYIYLYIYNYLDYY